MRRTRSALLSLLLAALVFATTASAQNGGLTPPDAQSPNADRITDLYWALVGVCGFVFVLVEGALVWFVLRYRRSRRARHLEGPQVYGSTRLELLWTAVPVLLLAGLAAFTFYKLPGIKDVPEARAGDRLTVHVEGHQFYWRLVYPDGEISVDRLVVPVGQVVELELTGEDVIHSWWVPQLGGKMDTIPGKVNRTWFQAKREGTYPVICAEFCGIQHTVMRGTVEVVSQSEYTRFLDQHRPGSQAVGRESVEGVCLKCHGLKGEGDIGPPLQGNGLIQDPVGLEAVMRNGVGRMPAVAANWPDDQVETTIKYLQERFGGG